MIDFLIFLVVFMVVFPLLIAVGMAWAAYGFWILEKTANYLNKKGF